MNVYINIANNSQMVNNLIRTNGRDMLTRVNECPNTTVMAISGLARNKAVVIQSLIISPPFRAWSGEQVQWASAQNHLYNSSDSVGLKPGFACAQTPAVNGRETKGGYFPMVNFKNYCDEQSRRNSPFKPIMMLTAEASETEGI